MTGTLASTGSAWKVVELKPTGGNLPTKRAAIEFASNGTGELADNFEINDITIVYRNKSIK